MSRLPQVIVFYSDDNTHQPLEERAQALMRGCPRSLKNCTVRYGGLHTLIADVKPRRPRRVAVVLRPFREWTQLQLVTLQTARHSNVGIVLADTSLDPANAATPHYLWVEMTKGLQNTWVGPGDVTEQISAGFQEGLVNLLLQI
jgi:hypothetical protein